MTSHYDRDTLIDYQHRALDPDADAAVFAHLEACAACLTLHDEEAALGEHLRALARADERDLPSLVKARVWDAVRNERPSFIARVARVRWGPALAVPVAAAFILGIYFGTPVFRGAVPGLPATFYLDEHSAESQDNPLGPGAGPGVYETTSERTTSPAASYIDTADAATLDDADGAGR
jgi:hypothetical protein